MRLFTSATLGVTAVLACAAGAAAQTPGCATCGTKPLAGAVPNTIPHCSKHDGLTQYPLSEKRYIKQFCNPTICPNSCFGHFKTQWAAWPQACPSWPTDGVAAANFGPNFTQTAPPVDPDAKPAADPKAAEAKPAPDAKPAAEPKPAPTPMDPPSKPLDLPPSKPLDLPPSKPLTPTTTPPGVKLPELPPAGTPGKF